MLHQHLSHCGFISYVKASNLPGTKIFLLVSIVMILAATACGGSSPPTPRPYPTPYPTSTPYTVSHTVEERGCFFIDPQILYNHRNYSDSSLMYGMARLQNDFPSDNYEALEDLRNAVQKYTSRDPLKTVAAISLFCTLLEEASYWRHEEDNTYKCRNFLDEAYSLFSDDNSTGEDLREFNDYLYDRGYDSAIQIWSDGCAGIPKVLLKPVKWTEDSQERHPDLFRILVDKMVQFEYFIAKKEQECKAVELMVGGALPPNLALSEPSCELHVNNDDVERKRFYLSEEGLYCYDVAVYQNSTENPGVSAFKGTGPIYIPDEGESIPVYEVITKDDTARLFRGGYSFILYQELGSESIVEGINIFINDDKLETIVLKKDGDSREGVVIEPLISDFPLTLEIYITNQDHNLAKFVGEIEEINDDTIWVVRPNFENSEVQVVERVCLPTGDLEDGMALEMNEEPVDDN